MGNANRAADQYRSCSVHPHVHGERVGDRLPVGFVDGSSPRTWGTPLQDRPLFVVVRFIPTYMGNARRNFAPTKAITVHPHVHGERGVSYFVGKGFSGSSPRTWGTLVLMIHCFVYSRFIPTYMGNAHPFLFQKGGRLLPPAQAEDQEIVTGSRLPHLPHSGLSNEPHSIPSSLSSPAITPAESLPGTGRNDTSLTPSNSTGTRRFVPSVVKS